MRLVLEQIQTQAKSKQLGVQLDVKLLNAHQGAQAYLAVGEDCLVSKVTLGENADATLHHASVMRA